MAGNDDEFATRLEVSGVLSAAEVRSLKERLDRLGRPGVASPDAIVADLLQQKQVTDFQAGFLRQAQFERIVLGNYVLLDQVGEGGMGQVFKAMHRRMERVVAIKILPARMSYQPSAVKRFHTEVKAISRLNHPNIVVAYDADEANGLHFLVMEYVEGSDLGALVKKDGPLPVAAAVSYVLQAARGLECAHRAGIIHRDIKPANLLLDRQGTIKVLDLGLARLTPAGESTGSPSDQTELTQSGMLMGTIDFMSPEQAVDTHTADHRSDIYSLGCTLFFLLTGNCVFGGGTGYDRLAAHREKVVPRLRDVRSQVPDSVERVFQRMLAKKPQDRQQSMGDVIQDLQACDVTLLGSPALSPPSVAPTRILEGAPALRAAEAVRPETCNPGVAADRLTGNRQGAASQFKRWWAVPSVVALAATILIVAAWTYLVKRAGKTERTPGTVAQSTHRPELGGTDQQPTPGPLDPVPPARPAELKPVALAAPDRVGPESQPSRPQAPPLWAPGLKEDALPGLVPRPAALPGIARWQAIRALPAGAAWSVTFSPDHRHLAVVAGGWGRIFSWPDRQLVRAVPSNYRLEWSPDGKWVAATDGTVVRIWNSETWRPGPVLKAHRAWVMCLAWSPDSRWLATGGTWGDGTIRVWKASGELTATWEYAAGVSNVAWNRSASELFAGGGDGKVRAWNVATRQEREILDGFSDVYALALSPDGKYIAAGDKGASGTSMTRVRNLESMKEEAALKSMLSVTGLAWSRDSRQLVGGSYDTSVSRWTIGDEPNWIPFYYQRLSVDHGGLEPTVWSLESVAAIAASSDGEWIASVGRSGSVLSWNLLSDQPGPVILPITCRCTADWSPDGGAMVLAADEGAVCILRNDGTLDRELKDCRIPNWGCVAWSPDGTWIAASSYANTVQLRKPDGAVGPDLKGHANHVNRIAWKRDGQWLASSSSDGTVRIWKVDGTPGPVLSGHGAPVHGVAWSPDGERLATSGDDKTVRLWKADGTPGPILSGHEGPVYTVGWSPDGVRIASGEYHKICIWNSEGKLESTLRETYFPVNGIAWSADGRQIAKTGWQYVTAVVQLDGSEAGRWDGVWGAGSISWNGVQGKLLVGGCDSTVRVLNPRTASQERVTVVLPDHQLATFGEGGELLSGNRRALEQELRYVLESTEGRFDLLKPSEFEARATADKASTPGQTPR